MKLQKQFKKETGIEKPFSNGLLKTVYQQKYIKWLESKVKKLNIVDVSKRLDKKKHRGSGIPIVPIR
jgi:hypothetical protein